MKAFRIFTRTTFWLSIISLIGAVHDAGFGENERLEPFIQVLFLWTITFGIGATVLRYIQAAKSPKRAVIIFDSISILFLISILIIQLEWVLIHPFLHHNNWLNIAILLVFVREFSALRIEFKRALINPAQLFVLSFLLVIIVGAFLLMLPNATHAGIRFIDALFTATSAVCVTGLIVVDTGSYFTHFGQTIILVLIQIGGLGIMTFASYFSYFFSGGSSYENHLVLSDMTNEDKLSEVFVTLKRIIQVTFFIELIGAILLYFTLPGSASDNFTGSSFFAIFHAISAFCNAGFSTLSNSLYDEAFRFNYGFQLIIIFLFAFGGIGFPIMFNIYQAIKTFLNRKWYPLLSKEKPLYTPWILNLNTRIILITTLVLTVVGTVWFFFFEYDNTLSEHGWAGKLVTSLFGAATPRTAGFNTIDMAALKFPTLMMVFLLMWVGASPGSTGGGIKTSTFAIGLFNIISLARGKEKIEIFQREIADISVRRAFAIISLSLIIIALGIVGVSILDPQLPLLEVGFECFSAYSTVGLSLGITDQLSQGSKWIIIFVMFVGRVSMLSILIALLPTVKYKNYQYPSEEILIN
jgi:trk system potassium uptake protein TrkH